jgi:hypothetical protein
VSRRITPDTNRHPVRPVVTPPQRTTAADPSEQAGALQAISQAGSRGWITPNKSARGRRESLNFKGEGLGAAERPYARRERKLIRLLRRAWRGGVARLYPDSSERLSDLRVRVRSLLANSAATGLINRITPKSSPSAMC